MRKYTVYVNATSYDVEAEGHFYCAESAALGYLFLTVKGAVVAGYPVGAYFTIDQSTIDWDNVQPVQQLAA